EWVIDRFIDRRRRLHVLQYEATRLREKPVVWSLLLVVGANVLVFWSIASGVGSLDLARTVVFAQSAVGVSMIAFGGLSWALDGASAPVDAVLRLETVMDSAGALETRPPGRNATAMPAREIRFRDLTF